MKTPFFRAVLTIVRKDLRAELRTRELLNTMVLFAVLSILIFSFALELDRLARQEAISGVLWVTIVFSSILGLNRSLAVEREHGNLDAMLLSPISRPAIYMGKLVSNFLVTFAVALMLLPLATILYNITFVSTWLLVVLVLGTLGFSTVGTLLATMTVQTRARESLLPIVMMPIVLPLLLVAVRATTAILNNAPINDWLAWPQILVVIDLIYLVMCYLGFEFVVEE